MRTLRSRAERAAVNTSRSNVGSAAGLIVSKHCGQHLAADPWRARLLENVRTAGLAVFEKHAWDADPVIAAEARAKWVMRAIVLATLQRHGRRPRWLCKWHEAFMTGRWPEGEGEAAG